MIDVSVGTFNGSIDKTGDDDPIDSFVARVTAQPVEKVMIGVSYDAVIENMVNWRHSGFNVYCGSAIWPHNEEGLENLARYIIRASFSLERMTYIPAHDASDGVARVIYESKDGTRSKTFNALDWPRR